MRFSILSAFAFVASVVAQGHNAFNLPTDGTQVLTAGQPTTFTWSNKAGNTVSLILRNGANSNLNTVTTIADHIANTGSFTWNVPASTPEGNTYAIQIVNNDDPSDVNYTQQFVIKSDVKAIASGTLTGVVTATSASLITSQPTAAGVTATGSATASGLTTSVTGSANGTQASNTSASKTASGPTTSAASGTVPTNAAARPAVGAAGALLAVAAGFAIAL